MPGGHLPQFSGRMSNIGITEGAGVAKVSISRGGEPLPTRENTHPPKG